MGFHFLVSIPSNLLLCISHRQTGVPVLLVQNPLHHTWFLLKLLIWCESGKDSLLLTKDGLDFEVNAVVVDHNLFHMLPLSDFICFKISLIVCYLLFCHSVRHSHQLRSMSKLKN